MPQRSPAPAPEGAVPRAADRRRRVLSAFAAVAVVEAVTWAGLLVGMFLDHVTHTTHAGVWLFGRLHGAAFTAYVVLALLAARSQRWSAPTAVLALAASVPPLCSVAFERWARRTGRLHPLR